MSKTAVQFRPLNHEDLDTVSMWFQNFEDIALFDRGLPIPVSTEFVRESWKPSLDYSDPPKALWFVAETPDKSIAGICGLQAINYIHGDAIVPVFVDETMRHKGLACAMGIMLNNLAFDQLRLHRVSTLYRADNAATKKLVEKLGFSQEGAARQAWYADGEHKDIIQVGILKSEWFSIRDKLRSDIAKGNLEISNKSLGFD